MKSIPKISSLYIPKDFRAPDGMVNIIFTFSRSNKLHPGDKVYLNRLADELNTSFGINEELPCVNIDLSPKRHAKRSISLELILDFSQPCFFNFFYDVFTSIEIHFSFFTKTIPPIRPNSNLFIAPEIMSSKIRILGTQYRMRSLVDYLTSIDTHFIYLGKDLELYSSLLKNSSSQFITGFDLCHTELIQKDSMGLLCYDNYWMHTAFEKNVTCFVLQRKKFSFTNTINHISLINPIANRGIYYC